jgi:hypothetical protein
MKDCGTFKSALAVRTLADAYGFDTNGPEDELKRAGVTYELRIEVRWYVRNNGLIEYQVLICADLTVALPSGQPQTTTDYWLTVWGHYDDPNRG